MQFNVVICNYLTFHTTINASNCNDLCVSNSALNGVKLIYYETHVLPGNLHSFR
jgi:hypothetical protein